MKHHTLNLAVVGALIAYVPVAPALAAAPPAAAQAATDSPPLTGAAWRSADLAYRAYAGGDYAAAARHAREAARRRPDLPRLAALVGAAEQAAKQGGTGTADTALLAKVDAAEAADEIEVELALAEQGLRAPGAHAQLASRAKQLRSRAAMQLMDKALKAAEGGDAAAALAAIRSAPAYDPDAPQYRLLLIDLLNQNKDADGAQAQAKLALAINNDDAPTQAYAAFLLQQKGERAQASALFRKALDGDALGDADLRNLRLIVADAALAAGDGAAALAALAPIKGASADVRERRALAQGPAGGWRAQLAAPRLRCVVNRFGPVCSLFAGPLPSQLLSAEAYRLVDEKKTVEALAVIDRAIALGGGGDELPALRKQILGLMAREQATIAFRALAAGERGRAREALRLAIGYAPDVMSHRMMLIDMYAQDKDYAQAERLASEAMRIDADDPTPRVMRGYLRQAQGRKEPAREDYHTALASRDLVGGDRVNAGLYVADALWAGGDAAEAARVLSKLPASNAQVRWRRRLVDDGAPAPALLAPAVDYRATPYDTVPSVGPSPYATDTLVTAIFNATAEGDDEEAVALAKLLNQSAPDNVAYQRVLALTMAAAGDERGARKINQQLAGATPSLDFAYMAQRAKAPELAARSFDEIDAAGQLPDRSLRDAGYAALGANERGNAASYFKRAILAARDGDAPLDRQALFDTRRTIEQLERVWGAYASLSFRGAAPQTGPANTASGDSTQLGTEAYWRPTMFNNNNRYIDLYARLSGTPHSSMDGVATGADSTQAALGVRVKPFASQSVVVAAERQVAVGARTEGDWLLRAGYSGGFGTDLAPGNGVWSMGQLYAEAGRYLSAGINYATAEAQLGRSFKAPRGWPLNTVLTPYLVLGTDYNEGFLERRAIGAGVGMGLRHWFSEDRYTAPRAYVDFTLQYRARLGGDDRAGGVVMRAIINR